jgi:hypothetical protein
MAIEKIKILGAVLEQLDSTANPAQTIGCAV